MRVLIADDEPWALVRMAQLLNRDGRATMVAQARDGAEAAQMIVAHRPDLAFLDIRMPHRDGMALARALAADPASRTEVVFVTAYDHFAAEAFDLDAVDYLLKPVTEERLSMALARAARRRAPPSPATAPEPALSGDGPVNGFWIKRREGIVRLSTAAIDWIEAAGDYVLLHTPAFSHMHRTTMEALHKTLDPKAFLRVSRSAIVRRAAVTGMRPASRGGLALLIGESVVPVGSTYRRAVRDTLDLPYATGGIR